MPERMDQAPCGLVEFSSAGLILYINATLAGWLQPSNTEYIGQRLDVLLTLANQVFFHTHFFPRLQLNGRADEIFLTLKTADGAGLPVVASAARLETGNFQCVFLPVPQRRRYEDEILQAKKVAEDALKNNEELNAAKSAVEKHALALERRIRETEQRNEEIKAVSQILSHDLREPVRKIRLFADLTRSHVEKLLDHEPLEALGKIESDASQMSTLLSAIRQFLQVDTSSASTVVDLSELMTSAIANVALKHSFSDWEIEVEPLPKIHGRTGALLLLFSQLLENAIKFRDPSRKLRVKITAQVIQQNAFEDDPDRYHFVDFLRVKLQDNGRSFDPKYSDYIFGLLKKADLNSPGLGLGLALCKKVVDSHFGTICAVPNPGTGTTILIELPVGGF